jgi:hypothetical protein
MIDPRTVLDGVRGKVSPNAKLLVAWLEEDEGVVRVAQANMNQSEISMVIESLRANAIQARINGGG